MGYNVLDIPNVGGNSGQHAFAQRIRSFDDISNYRTNGFGATYEDKSITVKDSNDNEVAYFGPDGIRIERDLTLAGQIISAEDAPPFIAPYSSSFSGTLDAAYNSEFKTWDTHGACYIKDFAKDLGWQSYGWGDYLDALNGKKIASLLWCGISQYVDYSFNFFYDPSELKLTDFVKNNNTAGRMRFCASSGYGDVGESSSEPLYSRLTYPAGDGFAANTQFSPGGFQWAERFTYTRTASVNFKDNCISMSNTSICSEHVWAGMGDDGVLYTPYIFIMWYGGIISPSDVKPSRIEYSINVNGLALHPSASFGDQDMKVEL